MSTPITSVSGVGTQTAEILVEHGFENAEALAAAKEEDLVKISGFGPARAQKFIEAAQALLASDGSLGESSCDPGGVSSGLCLGNEDKTSEQPVGSQEDDSAVSTGKNSCTQKLSNKKKKIKKVRVKVKKKKKKSSRKCKSK